MQITYKIYENRVGVAYKVSDNPGINPKQEYNGNLRSVPVVGMRFRCGTLSTNIVARIIEESSNSGTCMTISGSVYKWEITTDDLVHKLSAVEIPPRVITALKEFKKKQGIKKYIKKL